MSKHKTIEQVLADVTESLQASLDAGFEGPQKGRMVKAPDHCFEVHAHMTSDLLMALHKEGDLPLYTDAGQSPYGPYWPELYNHYYPEFWYKGSWEQVDWGGPWFVYTGTLWDPNLRSSLNDHSATPDRSYAWILTYNDQYGPILCKTIRIERAYEPTS